MPNMTCFLSLEPPARTRASSTRTSEEKQTQQMKMALVAPVARFARYIACFKQFYSLFIILS